MARDTTQQDKEKRTQQRASNAAPTNRRAAAQPASERQAPIQTGRESTAQPGRESATQTGRAGQGGSSPQQPGTTRDVAHRVGMTAPIRGAGSGLTAEHRGSPFSLMQQLSDDMDRLFQQFGFGRSGYGLSPSFGSLLGNEGWADRPSVAGRTRQTGQTGHGLWAPQIEAFRRGGKLVVRADLPGVKKEDVHVEVENDVLSISGERSDEREQERDGYYTTERSYGQFYRALALPEGVNADQCDASFKDGVLEITLNAPKEQGQQSRKIQIR